MDSHVTKRIALPKKISPRDAWRLEHMDLTPWIGRDGLPLLSETLGMNLEVQGSELQVGPYFVDLVLRDTISNQTVIVENQLAKVDHSHLGQGLVYAAGMDADVVVWIATEITDEHRAAIDWLNKRTTEGTSFYLLKLECLEIEDAIAPLLSVVAGPNDWQKATSQAARRMPRYWDLLLEYMEQHGYAEARLRSSYSKTWLIFRPPIKRRLHWAWFAALIKPRDHEVIVHLHFRSPAEVDLYRALLAKRSEIDAKISGLRWADESADRLELEVVLNSDPADESKWPEQFGFLAENLRTFVRVLSPYIEALALESEAAPFRG